MILIKDRHYLWNGVATPPGIGKYDTYKGSTHVIAWSLVGRPCACGKYDTYKGSTPCSLQAVL